MSAEPQVNPDPARLAPDAVRDAFLQALADEDSGGSQRLAERARLVLDERALASDAQGYAVALIDWACADVLAVLDLRLTTLPHITAWEELPNLDSPLADISHELEQDWHKRREAHGHTGSEEQWRLWSTVRDVQSAIGYLRKIPRYRLSDPNWRSKRERPTPHSLCEGAADYIAGVLTDAIALAPDAEWALDRLGLAPHQKDEAESFIQARRALASAGIAEPGARLIAYAAALCRLADASASAEPRALAQRALDAAADSPSRIVGESAALAARPLPVPAATVADAARAALIDLSITLVDALRQMPPAQRSPVTVAPSRSTPIQTPASRPGSQELAARAVRGVQQGRREVGAALGELRGLAGQLSERELDTALDAIVAHTLGDRDEYAYALDKARLNLGGIDGPLLIPVTVENKLHLWRSAPGTDANDPTFAETVCGVSLAAGRYQRSTRRAGGPPLITGYQTAGRCAACEQLAAARGWLHAGTPPPATPSAELAAQLRAVALAYGTEPDDELDGEFELSAAYALRWKLSRLVRRFAIRRAAADAAALGELPAQRILGPARYRKEAAPFPDGRIAAVLAVEDWETIAQAEERSIARRLVDLARQRRDERSPAPSQGVQAPRPVSPRPALSLVSARSDGELGKQADASARRATSGKVSTPALAFDTPTVMVRKGSRVLRDPVYKTRAINDGEDVVLLGSDRFGGPLRFPRAALDEVLGQGVGELQGRWGNASPGDASATTSYRAQVELPEVRLFVGARQALTIRVKELRRALGALARH